MTRSDTAQHLILCVEDERRLRSNIVEELVDAGYCVIEADDGHAALELLADQRPDLILCDITMPRMGGYELLRRVRASGPDLADVPFLFLTALSDRLAVIEGKTAGADDYLPKPIDFDLMLATVRSRLNQVVRIRASLVSSTQSQHLAEIDAVLRKGLHDLTTTLEHIALGVVLFDAHKSMLHHNRQAAAILGTEIGFANGRLTAGSATQSNQLRKALDAAVNGQSSDFIAVSQDRPHPLLVQFIALNKIGPAGASAAMFMIDTGAPPPVSEALATRLFNLTPTEARVAAAIARGQRTDEIARDMGISGTTLAFHMRNVFRKAGVGRQQDLMAVLFRSSVLAGAD